MRRIAILTPYSQPTVGGISTFVAGLSGTLKARGHLLAVMSGRGAGDLPDHSDLGDGPSYVRQASRLLEAFSPDVVHCHSHWPMLEAGEEYGKAHPSVRLVFSFHTTPRFRKPAKFRKLLQRVNVVTFVSKAQREEIVALLKVSGDLRILRPATTIPNIDREEGERWKLTNGFQKASPLLSFIGPLEYPKKVSGVIDLVKSIPLLRPTHPRTQLAIAGDGRLRPKIQSVASKLGSEVKLLGTIPRSDLLLAATDIYCHISYQEGLPLALLEAMAAGRCVVASNTGGIPELVDGENGLVVRPGPESIASAVRRVAEDGERQRRMSQAAAATIRSAYTWDKRIEEVNAAYGLS